jgi:hypothetical protein
MAKVKSEGKKVYWWFKCRNCLSEPCYFTTHDKDLAKVIGVCPQYGHADWRRIRKPPREVMG